MPPEKRASLGARATLVELGEERVDVRRLLAWLGSERGCRAVLAEGGGALNADLFAARAVDILHVTLVPRILGGTRAPTLVGGDGFADGVIPDARLVACEVKGDELFLQYAFAWPEP
jgi:riboflavin biosynthesis pyrimidine reductase